MFQFDMAQVPFDMAVSTITHPSTLQHKGCMPKHQASVACGANQRTEDGTRPYTMNNQQTAVKGDNVLKRVLKHAL